MDEVDLYVEQTRNAYEWTIKIIDSIPISLWEETPDIINSNVTWQVGHLILSIYYHTVMTITGHQPAVLDRIPMKEYSNNFGMSKSPIKAIGKVELLTLYSHLKFIQEFSVTTIDGLTNIDLYTAVEPTRMPHPIAKQKREAIDWNIKHTFWHLGQLGLIKRVVDKGYDFLGTRSK